MIARLGFLVALFGAALLMARDGWAGTAAPDTSNELPLAGDRLVILSAEDAARYRRIFALQAKAKWGAADKLIRSLDDRLLMGHVLFQRYMHPTGYRSRYGELANWLKQYGDLPGAFRVYRLAVKRKPRRAAAPKRPPRAVARAAARAQAPAPMAAPARRLPVAKRREIATLKSRVRRYLRRGRPERAEKRLWASRRTQVLEAADFDVLLAAVAESYFYQGDDDKALALATLATRSPGAADRADWIAGLAAWRLDRLSEAAGHFERLSASKTASPWTVAAAAFWGARGYLVTGKPDKVNRLLALAAAQRHSFYGLIAARQLGKTTSYMWQVPALSAADFTRLSNLPAARRAIALTQAGQPHLADQDLKLAIWRAQTDLYEPLLGLAAGLKLPSSQLALTDRLPEPSGGPWDSLRYPLPDWEPEGGFSLDRAVLYAVIRQESRFNARARSAAGARGLMQLMPRTASFIGRDRSLRWSNKTKLYTPSFNMALGQRYLEYLAKLDYIGGNMFLVVGAYNGGPGNISRWLKQLAHGDDWLLFIESIPRGETRDFIEKVLSNLWIYRMRLGQPAPTLEAVARGDWPLYTALDHSPYESADAGQQQDPTWPVSTNPAPSSPSLSPY